MLNRNRMITVAAAVTAVLAAGSGAAVASTSGGKPGAPAAPAAAVSASKTPGGQVGNGNQKPPGPADNGNQAAFVAAVAAELHLGTAQVSAALQPLFAAAGPADTSSLIAAAARSLGVSTQQLGDALVQAKQSLAPGS